MGGDGKVAKNMVTTPRKQTLRLGFVCRRSGNWEMLLGTTPVRE